MTNMQVANTILEQLGGPKIKAMLGVETFWGEADCLFFDFKGSRKFNKCKITLTWDDLYTMELYKTSHADEFGYEPVFSESGLYFDMLIPTFEDATGLYLSL